MEIFGTSIASFGWRVESRAKTNAYLRVVGRDDSGLHILRSLLFQLELADNLDFCLVPGSGNVCVDTRFSEDLQLHILACQSEDPYATQVMLDGMLGSENLAYKAAKIVLKELRSSIPEIDSFDLHVDILKRIPFGAGLGGGSSNAAAIALALPKFIFSKFTTLNLSERDKMLAESRAKLEVSVLGSDIPAMLSSSPVFLLRTGDLLLSLFASDKILRFWRNLSFVVVKPPCSVSTGAAYSWLGLPNEENDRLDRASYWDMRASNEMDAARKVANLFGFSILSSESKSRSCCDVMLGSTASIVQTIDLSCEEMRFDRKVGDVMLDSSLSHLFYNDFERVVLSRISSVAHAKSVILNCGGLAFLSGSGSSVIGVFDDEEIASIAKRADGLLCRLRDAGYFVFWTRLYLSSLSV